MSKAIARGVRHASLALIALSSVGGLQSAFAIGTDASTSINNRATVNYSVGGVAQTPIESSPTGNSAAGVGSGADTTFVVDNKILHTVAEVGGAATATAPGATNVVATFSVTNTGNAAQGYQLAVTNLTGGALFSQTDNTDVSNLRAFRDVNNNSTYEPGVDTEQFINSLAEDATVRVFVVADVPVTTSNNQYANVQLAARAATAGTNGATLVTQSTGADNPTVVDIVFADVGATARDGIHEAADQYTIQSASLTVSKARTVISDPFNNTTNPKAIPGAVVEYAISVANTGATTASGVTVVDPVPTNTTFVTGAYAGTTDVSVQVGAATPTYCIAEAGGADTNADGCYRNGAQLRVGAPMAVGSVATGAGNAVTVRFRVTIN